MSQTVNAAITVVGIDIGKNSFHVVGHDERGAIVLRQKWSRGQVEARLANMPPCLIGMEAWRASNSSPVGSRPWRGDVSTALAGRKKYGIISVITIT